MEQEEDGSFDKFIELQMFITSAYLANDTKRLCLQLAVDAFYQKENIDLITGLRTRSQFGRPKWGEVSITYTVSKTIISKLSGANEEFEKGGGAGGSGDCPQYFFG